MNLKNIKLHGKSQAQEIICGAIVVLCCVQKRLIERKFGGLKQGITINGDKEPYCREDIV